MGVEYRRIEPAMWPAVDRAIAVHWQPDHPVRDRALHDWQYRGYGKAADGSPWAFVALRGSEVVAFVGLIPYMVRHGGPGAVRIRPQALVGLWFTSPAYRAAGAGVLLMRAARAQLDVLGSLGVNELAQGVYRRLGFPHQVTLTRWVAPLSEGYRDVLVDPAAAHGGTLSQWRSQVPDRPSAREVAIDPAGLAGLATADQTCGPVRTEAFYRWRYAESVGHRYRVLGCAGGQAVVRVEQPQRAGTEPVLRIIELLPDGPAGVELPGAVLAWGRAAGCCAADFQVTPHDMLDPLVTAAGMRPSTRHAPETALAELLRPYRPLADPINVVYASEPQDTARWRFVKSDGDMDRTNEPFTG